jgi:site-specific DNA-methyltransferase (adenine-specific)
MASCPQGGVVLDPFNGSGTTGVAAVQLGHSYIGIDLETAYLDLTQARLLEIAPELSERPPLRVVV